MMTTDQKLARLARARAHLAGNRLQPGTRFNGSVACDAVDILGPERAEATGSEHFCAIVAAHDGTAVWLEYLRDTVFEKWPDERRSGWHIAFAEALPAGVDFTPLYHRMCLGFLEIVRPFSGAWPAACRKDVTGLIGRACELHRQCAACESAWQDVRRSGETVWLAAENACITAFKAAPEDETRMTAAESGAESALRAVRSAVWSAWSPASGVTGALADWSAGQCAHEAVWSAGFGAAARRGKPLARRFGLPAWARVAEHVLHVLSTAHPDP